MSSNQSGEGEIRRQLIEQNLVDRTHREMSEDEITRIEAAKTAS